MADFIIRNFQSLKEVKLSVKGLTLLVGETDQGKSAVRRAIFAAANNRFKIGQVRHGEDYAEVKIRWPESKDVLTVRRSQTGSPQMQITHYNDDGEYTIERFSKLSRSVPAQVESFNNFGTIESGSEKVYINFQEQFDKPLLMEHSQKKVMEMLSASQSIEDLNLVHFALSKKREQNRGAFRTVDALMSKTNAEISTIKFCISEMESLYNEMESLSKDYDECQEKLHHSLELSSLISSLNKAQSKVEILSQLILKANELSESQKKVPSLLTLHGLLLRNSTITTREELLNKVISRCKSLQSYEGIYDAKIDVMNLTSLTSEIAQLTRKTSQLKKVIELSDAVKKEGEILSNISVLSTILEQKNRQDSRITELERIVVHKICPICGSQLENHE